jgi:histidine triad (HIT) family protein
VPEDCLFCRIIGGKVAAKLVHEDEQCVAFNDIDPQGKPHMLVVPRKHIPTVNDLSGADEALMGHLFTVAAKLARDAGVAGDGYRCVVNVNRDAQQSVFHIHLHVIGGRKFGWPPG